MSRLATAAIAVACGAVAACLYLGIILGTSGALILVYMTQLPLFVAGLWLGTAAAAVAGISGTLVLLGANDLLGAGIFAALNAGPVTLLVRQALLARRLADGSFAWYPPGLLTAWLTGLALAGIAAAVLLLGGPDGLHATLRDMVAQVLDRISSKPIPNRDQVAEGLAMIIPGVLGLCLCPIYLLTTDYLTIVIGFTLQGACAGAMYGQNPSFLTERFPTEVRARVVDLQ